jgi:Flp pilus assembly protein TadD
MFLVFFKNIIIVFLLILFTTPFVFSQEQSQERLNTNRGIISEDNLTELQKQARSYRREGLEQQSLGNLDSAMSLYQKAIQLDPSYAVAYNDLGIIYETYGWGDRAEENYLRALKLDSNFLSAYSNLALLYENKRDLNKAFFYWKKRLELGSPDDLWTQRAKKRMDDIMQVSPSLKQDFIENQTAALTQEVAEKKRIEKLEEGKHSKRYQSSTDTQIYDRGE